MNGAGLIFTIFKNRFYAFVWLLLLSVVLTGCARSNYSSSDSSNYNNDYSIATTENGSCLNWRGNFENNDKVYAVQVGKLSGIKKLAVTTVDSLCEKNFDFSIQVKEGKAKLVLVDPKLNVTVLKEVTSQGESEYNGNITVKCQAGQNLLKFVGENYSGDFKIVQEGSPLFQFGGSLLVGKMPELAASSEINSVY